MFMIDLQVTSSPNASDLANSENAHEFVSRHALGKYIILARDINIRNVFRC